MNKYVVLFGDDPTGHTGFGRIIDHLVDAVLKAGLNPIVVSLKRQLEEEYKAPIINTIAHNDVPGWKTLEETIQKYKARIVISVGDPWDIQGLAAIKDRQPFYWISYTPVESPPYSRWVLLSRNPNSYLDVGFLSKQMDHIVTFTDFGKQAVEEMLIRYNNDKPDDQADALVSRIYLGVDTEFFVPGNNLEAKHALQNPLITDNTILFTCVKSNTYRSGFDTLLEAWSAYLRKAAKIDKSLVPRSKLYIHTDLKGNGYPLAVMLKESDFVHERNVIIDPNIILGKGYPIEILRTIYQASDIVLGTSRGEGFGLNIAEAMSCGVPCIVPDYAAPSEYIKNGGIKVPIAATFQPEFASTKFAIVDSGRMATEMVFLANSAKRRMDISKLARKEILPYNWDTFVDNWSELIVTSIEKSKTLKARKIQIEYV